MACGQAHISVQHGSQAPQQGDGRLDAAFFSYLPAARVEFLRRVHRTEEARLACTESRLLAGNPVEQDFLTRRLDELDSQPAT